jgi:hypothetical protein
MDNKTRFLAINRFYYLKLWIQIMDSCIRGNDNGLPQAQLMDSHIRGNDNGLPQAQINGIISV